ncbi:MULTISPECIES: prephenate dehydrogenase [unclassified Shewanella]|uniref:prephenate dehydrogenase n=1 Tax=unclassified Shewanella TaxID=196818 RepID=UPI0009705F5A|nr:MULTISPECIES: prephenate dehydrogenase [unclassified Shewanella]MDO6620268.1 prephenate dehydrogenase [Shewanella sp. 6_MG-2023]MDO6638555.1 prephenate dehydrogenase [Shewanella sp. 5_MG-2023]MDO6679546.1 prephenate dehydrogenase [Shewanella sp. 4_MG-2023]MDO6774628.1 prephenate dehydrogenase [Shewanella sp. 3_MG-2023]PMG32281.1 prephenate dehydrogenase [Shewanella sp. 10N.286.52.C2]
MPYTKVIQQIKESLQTGYRQAIDADKRLDELHQVGHGKFVAIFTEEQGFSQSSNRFLPYVQELADELDEIQELRHIPPETLEAYVKKLGALLQTLHLFKQNTK